MLQAILCSFKPFSSMKSLITLALPLVTLTVLFSAGCQHQDPWQEEGKLLIEERNNLEQQQIALNARIDSLWDATSAALAKALPADIPPTDKDIFLHSRNADHIRMFMSFSKLSPETQTMVNNAGKYDAMLASQIHDLQSQRESFEQHKIEFLQKVNKEDKVACESYVEQFRKAATGKSE